MVEKILADQLIEIYNMLDIYMREKLRVGSKSGHSDMLREMAKRSDFFAKHEPELLAFARLRNLVVHNVYPQEANPFAQPNKRALQKYEQLVRTIVEPPTALSIAVKAYDIYTTTLERNAIDVIKVMNNNHYSHVPVIRDELMFGVFSENTVFSYIAERGRFINEGTKISEFLEYLPLNKHKGEKFKFVEKNTSLLEIEELFRKELHSSRRLAVVYVTEKGRQEEKLLGMITPWDLAGR